MKPLKLLFAAIALSSIFGAGAAPAADLAVKAVPAVPVFSWTGFYAGVHGGAGVLFDAGYQTVILNDKHGVGGLAGGQLGFNYQTGMLVVGIEAEGFWSGMKVTSDAFNANTWFATATVRNRWDFDIAGRFGVAFDRALVYGKAGWVFGGFDWNYNTAFGYSNRASATLDGLLIGLGLEYAFLNNWTAKFEYDYLGFGARNVHFTEACTGGGCFLLPNGFTQNVSADKHIFKLGINYKTN
ncbi:outer membrane beta-barrel protein [Bradyrhizobium sp.]|uniref:outer membrane protein n=1 Tax=Bradyrhizobium sp. TaxID=376 RepID=UPI001D82DF95|nr:outer membrane beta-barrel protein [Bradyrhizobium sp.]MBI5319317.1 porin family protein [Bradyrhizobium sp.]